MEILYHVLADDGETRCVSYDEWRHWAGIHTCQLAHTVLRSAAGVVHISSVFLGYDRSHRNPPLLFETMVQGPREQCEFHRYASLCEAMAGHCDRVLEAMQSNQYPIEIEHNAEPRRFHPAALRWAERHKADQTTEGSST